MDPRMPPCGPGLLERLVGVTLLWGDRPPPDTFAAKLELAVNQLAPALSVSPRWRIHPSSGTMNHMITYTRMPGNATETMEPTT